MQYRTLGKTDLRVSTLGFGCGAVGGLLIKGNTAERARAVARAIDLGITYFDTAAAYGGGQSEKNLGEALGKIQTDVVIGSKIRLELHDLGDIEDAVAHHVEASLRRLGRDSIDLMQIHNLIGIQRSQEPGWLSVEDVSRVLYCFERLRDQGKIRFWGINGMGDIDAVSQCLKHEMHSIQVCYNLLNPTAAMAAPQGFPFADQGNLIGQASAKRIGVLAFRVLAGGALSGTLHRHANATGSVETIFSSGSYDLDVILGQQLWSLVEGSFADSLVEAAIRFAIGTAGVSSAVVGFSTLEQMEEATGHAAKGALSKSAISLLQKKWVSFSSNQVSIAN